MKFVIYLIYFILLFNVITSASLMTSEQKGDTLNQDERLKSNNGKYFAAMQSDGNFVVYSARGKNGRNKDKPIWASNTQRKGNAPFRLVMQNDGNLVLYDSSNSPKWNSNTYKKGNPPFNVIMQDDGNLVLYDKSNSPKWASNTNGRQ
jgi:hypothetical protein